MPVKIALAGNPNCGKTTMFNDLTGSNQYVGNWPGVTVEKKEGKLKGESDVIIQDLPGIYSLSPYTPEEVVARGYLVSEKPDAILNIVDAANIERNLYLTTQLAELGIPMIVALNMIDVTRKNGDVINLEKLGAALGCQVVETSALRGDGSLDVAKKAAELARKGGLRFAPHVFAGSVEHALAHIEDLITHNDGQQAPHHHHADGSTHPGPIVPEHLARWYAIKLFERDERVIAELNLPQGILDAIEKVIRECEQEMDDEADSIITNQRYAYVQQLVSASVKKGRPAGSLTTSDKIDRVMTNRFLALPIFVAVMFLVYYLSVTTVGSLVTDFTNDVFVGEWIKEPARAFLQSVQCAPWLIELICDGMIAGVGAVIGFVPQMVILFLMLAILEDVGYLSRVAFIMDRLFRKFGLSGKSFIPLLISSGCGVPGIMASRTIEQERDRRMTVITATFIPCSAKLPIIALIAGALFHNAGWVATSCYFIGVAAVIVSGIILKKTKAFAGEPSPFVMELPAYHAPSMKNVLHSVWERAWSFVKRAGTVILISAILIWFGQHYGWEAKPVSADTAQTEAAASVAFGPVEDMDHSILGRAGSIAAPIFRPLGFGNWKPTVATVLGLVAKEEVVNVFGVLYGTDTAQEDTAALLEEEDAAAVEAALSPVAEDFARMSGGFGPLAAFTFMLFNLLCAPCFAAIGAIRKEMNSAKWTWLAIGYQCAFAYAVGLMVFQLGKWLAGAAFGLGTGAALGVLAAMLYLLLRKNRHETNARQRAAA